MTDHDDVTAHPLTWPVGWPRQGGRQQARFQDHSLRVAVDATFAELGRMGVQLDSVVISSNVVLRHDGTPRSNQRRPDDPGVAVYFRFQGEPHVLACDRWDCPEHNLWAIAKHIEAFRGQDRWGVGTLKQAFSGYKALPSVGETSGSSWWVTLGFVSPPSTLAEAKIAFRERALEQHPDRGGDVAAFSRLSEAWAQAQQALRLEP